MGSFGGKAAYPCANRILREENFTPHCYYTAETGKSAGADGKIGGDAWF